MKHINEYISNIENTINESVTLQLVGLMMGAAYVVRVLHKINMEKPEDERDEFDAVEIVKKWVKDSKMMQILKKISNNDIINKCADEKDDQAIWKELESKLSKEEIEYMKSEM